LHFELIIDNGERKFAHTLDVVDSCDGGWHQIEVRLNVGEIILIGDTNRQSFAVPDLTIDHVTAYQRLPIHIGGVTG
jgi:hypothetical protein